MGICGGIVADDNIISIEAARRELEQALRPKQGETTAPTQERVMRAAEAGEMVLAPSEGGVRQWRISPTLDELRRRKTIDDVMHAAVTRFLQEYFLGHHAGVRTPGYAERASRSANPASPEEQRLHYFRETQKALQAVSEPLLDVMLRWVLSTLSGGLPLSCPEMIDRYARGMGANTASAKCGTILMIFCLKLCDHYGMQHRLNEQHCEDELTKLMRRFSGELALANEKLLGLPGKS